MVSFGTLAILAALTAAPSSDTVLLDFSATWCGPCREMDPIVSRLERDGYPIRRVDIDREPQLAAQYGVRRIPCFVIVRGEREIERVEGGTTAARLVRMFQQAQDSMAGPARSVTPAPLAQPGAWPSDRPEGQRFPEPPAGRVDPNALADRARRAAPPAAASRQLEETDHRTRPANPIEAALAATVRLTIEDPQHNSYGTGTIVDMHGNEALVLTCGHIFRDSQGRGKISADLFTPQGHTTVPGRLLEYDLDQDLALVVIQPGRPVTPARVAGVARRASVKDRVFTIGCDRGGAPTVDESHITAIDRYVGPRNIEVAGQPSSGRSGGGLFTADGDLIGVCNARDREYDEGLYAALPEVHGLLTRVGLEKVFAKQPPTMLADAGSPAPRARAPISPAARPLAPVATGPAPDRFTHAEQSFIETLNRHGDDAELILIVRPRHAPKSESDLFIFDRPSRTFVDQLAREYVQQRQDARRTTSHSVPAERATVPAARPIDRTSSQTSAFTWQSRLR